MVAACGLEVGIAAGVLLLGSAEVSDLAWPFAPVVAAATPPEVGLAGVPAFCAWSPK